MLRSSPAQAAQGAPVSKNNKQTKIEKSKAKKRRERTKGQMAEWGR
jgi:hypothetical protein